MIVVIRKPDTEPQPPARPRGHGAAIVALVALAIAAGAWFWTTRQPPQAGLGLLYGVIVVGGGAFLAALIAAIRAMSLTDALEFAWELVVGLFALIGAVLKGLWNGLMSLLGWD